MKIFFFFSLALSNISLFLLLIKNKTFSYVLNDSDDNERVRVEEIDESRYTIERTISLF
jgi:hypothetical protein